MTSCAVIALVFAGVILIGNRVERKRYRALAAERAGESFESFRTAFSEDVPADVIRVVYRQIELWTGVAEFPVRPDDGIESVYGMGEDLEDEVWCILKKCNRRMPDQLPAHVPIDTVRDLVCFIASCPPS